MGPKITILVMATSLLLGKTFLTVSALVFAYMLFGAKGLLAYVGFMVFLHVFEAFLASYCKAVRDVEVTGRKAD